MTESELKTWDNHLLKFYCQQCCYNGIEFDSVQSLERYVDFSIPLFLVWILDALSPVI